jgi:hypothetical protein
MTFRNFRRPRDGAVLPGPFVYLRGLRELDRLEAEGMTVDRSKASAWQLGRAAILADPPMEGEHFEQVKARVLARLREMNAEHRRATRTTASSSPEQGKQDARRSRAGSTGGIERAQVDLRRGAVPKIPVRNEKIDPILHDRPDDDWTPFQ